MSRHEASRRLKALAREVGFELVGVASMSPAQTASQYRAWLERGDHAGMAWMARNVALRCDPRGLLPGAMSALVVGMRYAAGPSAAEEEEGAVWPQVARYARGRDYHLTLRERLGRVAATLLAENPGHACRICVDTAPLLERELAARAGLGAVGKNTMLLHPEHGSWFLLGEILTTLELEADSPLSDLCGSCTRCLDACPTDALPAAYRLDANRCLSYLTIEHRGDIPEGLRESFAGHLFGCDICQEVCPWNRAVPAPSDAEIHGGEALRGLRLADLLRFDATEFRERLRDTPLSRPKLDGLQRNAALAGARAASPGLEAALRDVAARPEAGAAANAARWVLARRDNGPAN